MPRNTATGGVLENMVLPALRRGGYHVRRGVNIGQRLGRDRPHLIDALAWRDGGETHLISSKWQQTSGTAEQKVPFEIMCLLAAVSGGAGSFSIVRCLDCGVDYGPSQDSVVKAHVVLGGEGWTLREFYTQGGLIGWMPESGRVDISTLESFVARANYGKL